MIELKYKHEIVINLSRVQVVEYFTNPDTWNKWLFIPDTPNPTFNVEYEHLEGEPGQPGAKTLVRTAFATQTHDFRQVIHTMEIIMTVIKNDLPREHVVTFEFKNSKNHLFKFKGITQTSHSYFQEEGENVTRWINHNEVDLGGRSKISRFFYKRGFPGRIRRTMRKFKKHAEKAWAYDHTLGKHVLIH